MLTPEALERHLKVAHSHFGEGDLYDDSGAQVQGFFMTQVEGMAPGEVPEGVRYFRSPSRLAIHARITDRRKAQAWRVKYVEGEDGAYLHTMEATPVAA